MAETSARQVADYFVSFLAEHGDPVTNLKLQKLIYYAQAWYLALYDVPLFNERIEAWVHGPAVPSIYGEFKKYEWQSIPPVQERPTMGVRLENHIQEVVSAYGGFSAYQLERLTHQEDPWRNARQGLAPDESSNNIISHDDMKNYYRARLDGQNQAR